MAALDLQNALDALERRDLDAATASLERMVSMLPAHLAAHVLLARAYEAQERWNDALRSWAQAQVLLPNSPVVQEGKDRVLRAVDETETDDETPTLIDLLNETEPGSTAKKTESSEPTDVAPELDALRRRAEEEARRGGARTGRPSPPDTDPTDADPTDTPEERVEQLSDETDDDLDRLIEELESARIEPSSDAPADAPDVEEPEPPDDDADDLVSETLARIYASQEQYDEAAQVYDKLAEQEPERAKTFREKAAEMRAQADDE